MVSRGKAANELAQAKLEDPLPLRKAKVSQEAILRRAQKATAIAQQKTQAAKEAADLAAREAAEVFFFVSFSLVWKNKK